jgi:hypothetical protein
LIKECSVKRPFNVVYVEKPFNSSLSDDGTRVVRVKNYKQLFDSMLNVKVRVSTVRSFMFHANRSPQFRTTMNGDFEDFSLLKRGVSRRFLPRFTALYEDRGTLPIKPEKLKDVRSLLEYIDEENRVCPFYSSLHATGAADGESEDEVE